ncbi:MAG: pyrroline-5-carboxylate reductase [Carnobacterium sp.]|uniref:Pyrroline-5-carboxylate reductase n=1 Tax=Carnobacterium antarcticum TaxID=2126436 RepID=A0ABW4NQS4_9LACT|nr:MULTISPECIES: pyrroline-5-carboxylate reductase [unclassified Carnobacterium]ALV22488.1 Pyrroline-5-carboxylate reductase [Carnobacterium sp. CP1]QQP70408.1 pyrroline-5-carboxylate reductase [Carnobacterium sp. CS13]
MKVGFIGIGNMASAIIKGMIQQGHTKSEDIYVTNRTSDKLAAFTAETHTIACASNEELIKSVDVVVLATKPTTLPAILPALSSTIQQHDPLIVSIAAGTTLEQLANLLGEKSKNPIIRAMPNLNSMIGEGMTAVCGNAAASAEQVTFILDMFKAIGEAVELEEKDFSTFTAIAGSSPAYAFLFIDSLARGAVKNGMPKDLATKIAAQAVLGSAKMILESDQSPWNLIDQVCSPGGTTVAGIVALEDEKFISTVIKGVDATIAKDQELMQG